VCRAELPHLSVLHNDYATRGFEAIAINLEESMDDVVKAWARQNSNLHLRDDGYEWSIYSHNNAIPTNYVIDTAGVVRYWAEGYDETAIRNAITASLPVSAECDAGANLLTAPSGSLHN
jgi:hypothetical protein